MFWDNVDSWNASVTFYVRQQPALMALREAAHRRLLCEMSITLRALCVQGALEAESAKHFTVRCGFWSQAEREVNFILAIICAVAVAFCTLRLLYTGCSGISNYEDLRWNRQCRAT